MFNPFNPVYLGLAVVLFYIYFLLYILDGIAHVFTYFLFKCRWIDRDERIIGFNLNLVLPALSPAERQRIAFQTIKLHFLNVLIALNLRLIYAFPVALRRHYIQAEWPEDIRTPEDLRYKIVVLPHYGIYYDPVLPHVLFGVSMAPVYRLKNRLVEYLVFKARAFGRKVIGISQAEFKAYLADPSVGPIKTYDMLLILCDQKSRRAHPVTFLNQSVEFMSSPVELHKQTGRPIWAFLRRYNQKEFKIEYRFIPIQPILDATDPVAITQKIADVFTAAILADPEQYLWAYNRFQ